MKGKELETRLKEKKAQQLDGRLENRIGYANRSECRKSTAAVADCHATLRTTTILS